MRLDDFDEDFHREVAEAARTRTDVPRVLDEMEAISRLLKAMEESLGERR